jgi:hypothetical protein
VQYDIVDITLAMSFWDNNIIHIHTYIIVLRLFFSVETHGHLPSNLNNANSQLMQIFGSHILEVRKKN